MPWIAEELKLRTEQKIFTWLNPGLWQIEGWEEGGRGGERRERERGSRKSFTVCIIVRVLTTASLSAALQQWFWFSADDWWWLHCAVGYIQANSAHECVFLFTRVHSSSKYIYQQYYYTLSNSVDQVQTFTDVYNYIAFLKELSEV